MPQASPPRSGRLPRRAALALAFAASVPLTSHLTAFATAHAQEPVRVAEADHIGGWHGFFTWRDFPVWFPGGDVEVCVDAPWDTPGLGEPDTFFELRCDESGTSGRLTPSFLDICRTLDPVVIVDGREVSTIHDLSLPPGGDRCDLEFFPPIKDTPTRPGLVNHVRNGTHVWWRHADCARAADRVCLGDYAVAVDYMDSAGNWIRGAPQTKLSESAAVFYFFDPDNAEVLVKLLDACSLTGHRWLYSAPATDLAYRVTVYTPVEGVPHEWTTNAGGRAADTRFTSVWAITDTEAFRCSEEP